jgi:hypothetical protein
MTGPVRRRAVLLACAMLALLGRVAASAWQAEQTPVPKTIIDLQPFQRSSTVNFQSPGARGAATLINLNPRINAWFLLTLKWPGSETAVSYHLENVSPKTQVIAIDPAQPYGLRITVDGRDLDCELWLDGRTTVLQQAQGSGLPFAPLCGDRLYLRNAVAGTYTHLERVTNFLRDHVWGGEQIVGFVRSTVFRDAFIEKGVTGAPQSAAIPATPPRGPREAAINAAFATPPVVPENMEIDVGQGAGGLSMGRWYPVRDAPGIFVSLVEPRAVDVSASGAHQVPHELDPVEASALTYLVAMDLSQYELGFVLGTDHPRVGWSERVLESVRDPRLPGPDGIGSVAPLVVNGIVPPAAVAQTAAAFAGGFKREHGAFRYGGLALRNHGSHYGFIEQGTVFSTLQPELATLIVSEDGAVRMKTWTVADEPLLPHIKHARQNGVPLIEHDENTGVSSPGALVGAWGPGNWSGSDDERLRTLRAGACLQETGAARYLIYGYFSTATPAAMARVFQAYRCRYAMHLDMNALEHTYFALYTHANGRIVVQHLIEGMTEVDRKGGGDSLAPRFLSFPDDRDFFYLTRRK